MKLCPRKNLKKTLKTHWVEYFFLILLAITSGFLRFPQLGYSHFYGDETKTLFLRKDTSLQDFLLNQRKGPMQFLVSWGAENIFNDFDEAHIRLPFAIAGFFVVFIFYFVVKLLFNYKVALISTFLLSFNGFFVAFSRTAQYQSFLLLFGLGSVLTTLLYLNEKKPVRKTWLFFSGVLLALAYLTHYDAVFFDLVVAFLLLKVILIDPRKLREILLYLVPIFLIIAGAFYIPYFVSGNFSENTLGYIEKRVSGQNYALNNSFYTYMVYNPLFFSLVPFVFSLFAFVRKPDWSLQTVFVWFVLPFVLFELVFSNPGTHILNYLIPLFVLSALGMNLFLELSYGYLRYCMLALLLTLFTFIFVISSNVYIPALNKGYPWKDSNIIGYDVDRVDKEYHLFLYGFPYYRGWDQVSLYFEEHGMPHNFYTNDNQTIGEYYLHGVSFHKYHSEQKPRYIIDVEGNQELRELNENILADYSIEAAFKNSIPDEEVLLSIYKLRKTAQ